MGKSGKFHEKQQNRKSEKNVKSGFWKIKFQKKKFPPIFEFFPDVRQGGPLPKEKNSQKNFVFEILFFKIHFWHLYQIFDFVTFHEIYLDFPIKNTS